MSPAEISDGRTRPASSAIRVALAPPALPRFGGHWAELENGPQLFCHSDHAWGVPLLERENPQKSVSTPSPRTTRCWSVPVLATAVRGTCARKYWLVKETLPDNGAPG